MGTAILEVALLRVPNVIAMGPDHQSLTYGPIHCVALVCKSGVLVGINK